jgi:predicted nucleotidyltransferase
MSLKWLRKASSFSASFITYKGVERVLTRKKKQGRTSTFLKNKYPAKDENAEEMGRLDRENGNAKQG